MACFRACAGLLAKRSNLVVVCAGDSSLHPGYTEPQRNFDLCVVYFGEQEGRYRDQSEHYLASKGLQTQLLDELFQNMPELIEQYEQFWLPDDDLETNTDDVNRLFELFANSDFDIAQPSLAADSDAAISMLTCKNLGSCKIDFIEIMCPLFTRDSLKYSVQYFKESKTGWGVDELWSVHALRKGDKLGIFDQVQVGHYRPVGMAEWYKFLDVDPHEELKALNQKHGLQDRIKSRLHPLYEAIVPAEKGELPASSPFILGGQGGSCTRAVAEILLRTQRMFLDLDSNCEHPERLDSFCMRGGDQQQGLIEAELIERILVHTGSTDYKLSQLPEDLKQELLARGRRMQECIRDSSRDGTGMDKTMSRLGERKYRWVQWGWKEPRNMYYLPLWKELFGRFRFIHIVRDPRGIRDQHLEGESQFQQALLGHAVDDPVEGFERCWAKANLGVHQWAMREIPHHYLLVRAEELAGQDEKARRATSRLLNFVGLDFADRRKTDAVFRPLPEVNVTTRQGVVAEALASFGYSNGH